MFIEVERKDGRKARLRADNIVSVLEDETTNKETGLTTPFLTLQIGAIKVECINDNLISLFEKMTAAAGRRVSCVGTEGIDPAKRAPRIEQPVNVTELKRKAAK